ncbi:serine/threonine-protein kinase [Nocardioides pelophilus]|uniref:serine/threonine-protein kinase n=1 Tax=Nocardioides pelophilus TaxID=2172019 RepID=UPI001600D977|nr:serine/threonine-protein kinase [Nocardioides pelophilus]
MTSTRVADRYALDREIGRGASGAVWLARDEVLGRVVALKRIGIAPGASVHDLERAEREARLAAQVIHPNVISVFDFVTEGDSHWLVTEYVDGTTFASMIGDRGGLSPDEAAPMLLQAAEALATAHRLGIVHRDVKPSNILIGLDGTVKLSDFGIAKAVQDASLTQTGLVTGSPAYLAPEVATGASATPASDVWSFGATAYHALSGRPPYDVAGGDNAVLGVLYRIAHEDPPRLPDAGWLAPLIEATMDRDPDRRPPMEEVARFLRARPQPPIQSTQVLAAATSPTSTQEQAPMLPPPAPFSPATDAGSGSTALRVGIAGAAVVAVLAVIGVVLFTGGDDPDDAAAPNAANSTPASTDDSRTDSDDPETQPAPTAAELEEFAAGYISTAADDPDAGFALLTPSYQARSPEYADFWGTVTKPKILEISADPAALTVTYTYEYKQQNEGKRTETVTLQLVQDGDQLLIDDAATIG